VQKLKKSTNAASKSRRRKPKAGSKVKCKYCGKKIVEFSYRQQMKTAHFQEVKNLFINCDFCDAKYFLAKSLKIHMTRDHQKEVLQQKPEHYECDFDDKIFKRLKSLMAHMKTHQQKIKCKICQLEYKSMYLPEHMKAVHSTERNFQCKICKFPFKCKSSLNAHMKHQNKKFECKICSRTSPIQSNLSQHIKYHHENPGSFECEICGRKFNLKVNCKKHQRVVVMFKAPRIIKIFI